MTARRLALLALLPGLLAFAPAPLPRRDRAGGPDLTGTWEFVSWEEDGGARPESVRGWRGEAAGGRFDLVSGDGNAYPGPHADGQAYAAHNQPPSYYPIAHLASAIVLVVLVRLTRRL